MVGGGTDSWEDLGKLHTGDISYIQGLSILQQKLTLTKEVKALYSHISFFYMILEIPAEAFPLVFP